MRLRSLLFVPGDRPERIAKALTLDADGLILDLEDAVAPSAKATARQSVTAAVGEARDHAKALFVRINPLGSEFIAADLAAILPGKPDGIVLPKTEGAKSIAQLQSLARSCPPILALANETARSPFEIGSLADCSAALCGITWGAEDFAAAVGAQENREDDGDYTSPMMLARNLALFAAHACSVPAIETVFPDIRDIDGLAAQAGRAARDGFTGMLAIHPAQVPVINAAFTPSDEQVREARDIVAAFEAQPNAGVLKIGGKMVDAPHIAKAHAILIRAGESA